MKNRISTSHRMSRFLGAVALIGTLVSLLVFALVVWAVLAPRSTLLPSPPSVSKVVELLPGGALDEDDGISPEGRSVSVFDDDVPAVTNLDPALLEALREAADDAERDGVSFTVNSGWRSERYQQSLLDDAISTYGSREEAARWVATPETSAHVSGKAIDLGPLEATSWLSHHGARYGLCQTYANESWHYELRPNARARGCPAMYTDPTEDPRMQP